MLVKNSNGLIAPPEFPASQAPGHVKKLVRPAPWQKATQLAFLRFKKKDLAEAERFWNDFGMVTVSRSADQLVMRGAGTEPAILLATKGNKSRYVGAAFVVPSDTDFARLERESNAVPLAPGRIPGGGRGVELKDPDGNELWLIADWKAVPVLPSRQPMHYDMNALGDVQRINRTVRTPIEPALVGRPGHVVYQTSNFEVMAEWYMRHLGLIPTDVQYLEDGSPLITFFRLDLGKRPADHHTLVLASALQARYEHSAWEVIDLDALGQGQQIMRARGHKHFWGIGRHLLGSQLFDYWKDADGFDFEHYTDGDIFTADHETRYVPFSTGSIWAWGDDAPKEIFPAKSLGLVWRALKLIRLGRLSFPKLRIIGKALDNPARPWL
jgi:catechol 2,3-dioxygenase-like lactoylglutathione lyase family enzyme